MGAAARGVLIGVALTVAMFACAAVTRGSGERLHLSKCGACHQRPARGGYDEPGWREILEGHRKRFPLTEGEVRVLSEYLSGGGEHAADGGER